MKKGSGGQLGWAEAWMAPGLGVNERLCKIDDLIRWYRVEKQLARVRSGEFGRPPYPPLAMFKALLLQEWYGLSGPGTEEALKDRLSFRRFCGFALEDATPDETTLCRFRQDLGAALLGKLLELVNAELDRHGVFLKRGTMIDATIVQAEARPPGQDAPAGAQSVVDPDADWTRKGGRSYFGYKAHIAVDQGSLLVRAQVLTPARVNESEVADALICGDEAAVYADKAYENKHRRARLKAAGIKDRIMHRSHKNQDGLPHWQRKRNALISRLRAPMEGVFGTMKRVCRYRRVRHFSLAANALQFELLCIAFNLRRAVTLMMTPGGLRPQPA